jgi:ubiquinone/menaquinone biosynthesis C-methylase UbiE
VNLKAGKVEDGREKQPIDQNTSREARWAFLRRPPAFLDSIMNRFESPKVLKRIGPYVNNGRAVADLGCGWGYYTFVLADLVGSEGKVYAVDLSNNCIRSIQKKAINRSYHYIETHASSAADLSFIKDRSVDFVFANGLLCSMVKNREDAVNEIKRILNPEGHAYISLGAPPPLGLVDENEWDKILEGFSVERGGIYKDLWALVSLRPGAA